MTANGEKIRIVFRGVRGSYPMPGPTTLRYGGNTTCQEIQAGGRVLIFDAGTGIIGLGRELMSGPVRNLALFFSHSHHDHIDGLLYFKPAYSSEFTVHIFGLEDEPGNIIDALEHLSAPAAHPVPFSRMGMKFTAGILHDGDAVRWPPGGDKPEIIPAGAGTDSGDVVVRAMRNSLHPIGGVLNFRLEHGGKSYVYATDVEGNEEKGDRRLAEFARGADLISHDGQYTSEEYAASRKGWGHSTVKMAIETARSANAGRLAIIHHEPTYSDEQLDAMESEAQKAFPGLFFAKEGQTVIL